MLLAGMRNRGSDIVCLHSANEVYDSVVLWRQHFLTSEVRSRFTWDPSCAAGPCCTPRLPYSHLFPQTTRNGLC